MMLKLKDNKNIYFEILDTSPNAIFIKDLDGIYFFINKTFEKLHKITNEKILGLTDHDIFPKELADKFRENDLKVLRLKKSMSLEESVLQGGSIHTVISTKFLLFDINKKPYSICGIVTDITERKIAEDNLEKHSKDHATLLNISKSLTSSLDMKTVLQNICDSSTHLVGLDTGAIYLIQGDGLYLGSATPKIPRDFPEVFRQTLIAEHPNIQKAISSRIPHILPDLALAKLSPAEQAIRDSRNMRTLIYVPLVIKKEVLGVLILGTVKETRSFSKHEIDLYQTLSHLAALSIENARLFEKTKQNIIELEQRIIERKKVTKELREKTKEIVDVANMLNQAQKVAKLGHYVFDIQSGTWTSSDELDTIFGIDKNYKRDLNSWVDIIHPDFKKTISIYLKNNILKKHQKFDREYKIVNKKTKKEKWVHGLGDLKFDKSNKLVEMFGTIHDISRRKESELALMENEERYRIIFDKAPDAYFISNLKGKTLDGNDGMEKLLGLNKKDIIGKNFFKLGFLVKGQLPRALKHLARNIQNKTTNPEEFTLNRKDGTEIEIEIRTHFVKINNITHILGIVRDITERKQVEKELDRKNKGLKMSNDLFVGRELKMIELKKEINTLLRQLGKKPKYQIIG